ncbi:hypothetical protein MYAM1_004041 [Malassezia yamatoensis]|uniref:Pentafunctional AROM polypeptide n=1 Tax=Malassezia yamatoensis TaxID=253288 RepID=A0AAJ6CJY2_9BASI|nr:hypothetical protein MYAM1_004041 [Malassezia yamatoensis]
MSDAGKSKVPSYHAPPSESDLSGATIHELKCLDSRIHLGYHLIPHIAKTLLTELPSSAYMLVTDTNLERLGVVKKFQEAFVQASPPGTPARVLVYTISPGEESKSRETKAAMEDWMLEHRLTRDTVVMACGGGVIGDLVGFVAATFMRGLKFVQIPTTLLAMVDSAVGGKTAIDHPLGKNLIGAFHQPQFVFVDAAFLLTLPPREFSNGMAEVVKTAAIWDANDFLKLETQSEAIRSAVLGEEARNAPQQTGHTLATRTASQTLLLDVIRGSIGVKAHIVTIDEKETGLRNLVNFGHSIGHAIEAVLTPEILHGECVSIGIMLEAEIARMQEGLPQQVIARLAQCLKAYDLPVSLQDPRIARLSKAQQLTTSRLLDIMRVDKKNAGSAKKIVLLSRIGATVEERASTVSDAIIARILAPAVIVRPVTPKPSVTNCTITTPGSKSVSNRALLLAALAKGRCRLRNVLFSDDTQVMMNALRLLRAASFSYEDQGQTLVVDGHGGDLHMPESTNEIYLQNAGTAARFMTVVACLLPQPTPIVLTGNARMKQRPIQALVDALQSNGSQIAYQGTHGCLPVEICGGGLRGGHIKLAADVSSQYVSAILLCAPYASKPVVLELVGDKVISQPYIDMTIAIMASFNVNVSQDRDANGNKLNIYRVAQQTYESPSVYQVESDASSATYPLALAAITGTQCTIASIGSQSLQGDAQFATKVLRPMGCQVQQTVSSTTVQGPPIGQLKQLGRIDMESMTDAFITAAVLLAVAAHGHTRIEGIANQRVKETNRLRAVIDELHRFGVHVEELDDGIDVYGVDVQQLKSAKVHCYDDHRIAMAFSVLGTVAPPQGVTLLEKRCVEKTWPGWWDDLQLTLGVPVSAAQLDTPLVSVPEAVSSWKPHAWAPLPPSLTPIRSKSNASVVCIGMRASGKTYVGQMLAHRLHRPFLDADEVLVKRIGDLGAFVAKHGWPAFRVEEQKLLTELLREYASNHVLALGGGVVESPECCSMLQNFAQHQGPVVYVVRDLDAIQAFLSTSDRPAYGEPISEVFARRRPLYEACSSIEVWNGPDVDASLVLQRCLATPLDTNHAGNLGKKPTPSYFVSLTFSDLSLALPTLNEWITGVDAIEVRVDMLHPDGTPSLDHVRKQVVLLRNATDLPLLYTVRSTSQAGRFPENQSDSYFALIRLGLRLGCELLDLEVHQPSDRLELVREHRGATQIVASAHDPLGSLSWNSTAIEKVYKQAADLGDIVKLVGMARTMQDNLQLEQFRIEHQTKPLIALNMGTDGQLSRILNTLLTPVTHPALPLKAAPGQLSVLEIHTARHLLGALPSRRFALLGTPIAHSLSPLIHNTGFQLLGLPYKYALHECNSLQHIDAELLRKADFGGASVTIPHKLKIMQYLDEITPEAQTIGAVNTVIPIDLDAEGHRRILRGDNTDWQAIHKLAADHFQPTANCTALVVGAGGSARAALYAMHKLGATQILLCNRTYEKAVALAKEVPQEWRVEAVQTLEQAAKFSPHVIVSNVPADATCLDHTTSLTFTPDLFASQAGVAIDMAYKPASTPLLQCAELCGWHAVPGIAILLEQAFLQFQLWTQIVPPTGLIKPRVLAAYAS